jgi:hypothetical protein
VISLLSQQSVLSISAGAILSGMSKLTFLLWRS